MVNEQVVQFGPMWILAGLSAGWIAETALVRRGYGLLADLGIGVGSGLLGGGLVLALSGIPAGMLGMFVVGFVAASGGILAQRLWLPAAVGVREREARVRLVALGGPPPGESRGAPGQPGPTGALARLATTGIYLLRGVPLELQRSARVRAVREGTTLRQVLLEGLGEYAAGSWTPRSDGKPTAALSPRIRATGP